MTLTSAGARSAGKFLRGAARANGSPPVFYPLGYDWKDKHRRDGQPFFAREVIVSTMGIVYSVGEVDRKPAGRRLKGAMSDDRWPAEAAAAAGSLSGRRWWRLFR